MNNRRRLLVAIGAGALGAPFASLAQQPAKVRRVGLLSSYLPTDTVAWHEAFRQGLRDLGWVEGKNISIEIRYSEGCSDRLPALAAELVGLKVDIIVASANTDARAAKRATETIPIVMASAGDPVAGGFVATLARPGGNVTGLSQIAPEMAGKRLELLKEIIPKLSRVAVLWNPQGTTSPLSWKETQLPARQLGIQLHSLEVRSLGDFDKAFAGAAAARAGALVVLPDPLFVTNLKRIADFAVKNHLSSIFHLGEFADAGGLMTYGPNRSDSFRRAATYVDKILKGAKPGDLPVEQPTKFELVINMKTAKSLGIKIPNSILVRAERVIQ